MARKSEILTAALTVCLLSHGALAQSFTPAPVPAAPAEVRLAAAPSRYYGGVEYLLWSVKDAPLAVPLLSTAPFTEPDRGGFLKDASATVLYGAPHPPSAGGNDTQSFPMFSGSRVTAGYWLDDAHNFALEGSAFLLQQQAAGYGFKSDSGGNPPTRIPLYNSVPYASGGVGMIVAPTEDGVPVSLPGDTTGSASFDSRLKFWGADALGAMTLYRSPSFELTGLGGFSYLNLSEGFGLNVSIDGIPNTPYAGESGFTTDSFKTENQFFGGSLGVRGRYTYGRFSAEATAKLGVGLSHEIEDITGGFVDFNTPLVSNIPGVTYGQRLVTQGPNGIFAQPSNEGRRSTDKFAVAPGVKFSLGYDLTSSIQLTVGYDFLYYSSVLRPTDQIDRSFSKGLPFQQDPTSTVGPMRMMRTTDFYAQGLNVGVAFKF